MRLPGKRLTQLKHAAYLLLSVGVLGVVSVIALDRSDPSGPPYSRSQVIAEIRFDWSIHDRRAPGSDNWPVTWAADDHQYTSWGDGGGFGGTNRDGRVSLGVARIEGPIGNYQGVNVWGGKDAENKAIVDGKSYGILALEGVLYLWVSPGSGATNYEAARLYRSTNHGTSWTAANWAFVKAEGIILPTFLQFGKDYSDSRDDFVYVYASQFKRKWFSLRDELRIHRPGEISLMRTPKSKIMERGSYEFFQGLDVKGAPLWTKDLASRQPVFEDPNGVGWNLSVSHNRGMGRYLLITEHTDSLAGNIGIFDGPQPWGPWTTVMYSNAFGTPHIKPTSFFWNFSNKWASADGKRFTLVFTGIKSNDAWNTVSGEISPHQRCY